MDVKNCRKCGRMFNYISGMPICPACREAAEAKFQEVKKFVQDNKTATMAEIVENCDVDSKQVQQWIREERLFFSDDSPIKLSCENCGATINTGRYCEKCKKDMASNISDAFKPADSPMKPKEPQGKVNSRMYTYDRK